MRSLPPMLSQIADGGVIHRGSRFMDWFLKRLVEYIEKISSAEVCYADLAEGLSDEDIVALEMAASTEFATFFTEMSSIADSAMATHPMGPAIRQATVDEMGKRISYGRSVRGRASDLFGGDQERLTRFESVVEGLRLVMVFFDLLPALRATELAVPWRAALGDKYDIGCLGIVVNMKNGHWRPTGSACPIDAAQIAMNKCSECDYFRGGTSNVYEHPEWPKGWKMNCNWPRNGSMIASPRPSIGTRDDQASVPSWLLTAFKSEMTPGSDQVGD